MSMSSYSIAQLAAMEREKIRQNIKESIKIICNGNNQKIINKKITYDYDSEDEIFTGIDNNVLVEDIKTDSFSNSTGIIAKKIDLSNLLNDNSYDQFDEKVKELLKGINDIECRNKEEINKVNNFVHWINNVTSRQEIDGEEKVRLIQNRLEALKGTFTIDKNDFSYEKKEYTTLCEKLGVEVKDLPIESISGEVKRLYERLFLQEEQNYIETTITEIIKEEMGLSVEGKCNLNESDGYLYNASELESCKIFVSIDGEGIMLDAVAPVNRDKDRVENEAKKVCEIKEKIVKKAFERGIILKTEVEIEPNYENMSKTDEIRNIDEINGVQFEERRRNIRSNQKGLTI